MTWGLTKVSITDMIFGYLDSQLLEDTVEWLKGNERLIYNKVVLWLYPCDFIPPPTLTDLKASLSQSCIISELCLRSRFYQRNYIDKPESAEGEVPPVEIELLNGFLLME